MSVTLYNSHSLNFCFQLKIYHKVIKMQYDMLDYVTIAYWWNMNNELIYLCVLNWNCKIYYLQLRFERIVQLYSKNIQILANVFPITLTYTFVFWTLYQKCVLFSHQCTSTCVFSIDSELPLQSEIWLCSTSNVSPRIKNVFLIMIPPYVLNWHSELSSQN